jgi:hypothetical protein
MKIIAGGVPKESLKRFKNCVLLTVHLDNLCNENQLYALFILNLFRHSTSTCRGSVFFILNA